jgi:hypothetical protein
MVGMLYSGVLVIMTGLELQYFGAEQKPAQLYSDHKCKRMTSEGHGEVMGTRLQIEYKRRCQWKSTCHMSLCDQKAFVLSQ